MKVFSFLPTNSAHPFPPSFLFFFPTFPSHVISKRGARAICVCARPASALGRGLFFQWRAARPLGSILSLLLPFPSLFPFFFLFFRSFPCSLQSRAFQQNFHQQTMRHSFRRGRFLPPPCSFFSPPFPFLFLSLMSGRDVQRKGPCFSRGKIYTAKPFGFTSPSLFSFFLLPPLPSLSLATLRQITAWRTYQRGAPVVIFFSSFFFSSSSPGPPPFAFCFAQEELSSYSEEVEPHSFRTACGPFIPSLFFVFFFSSLFFPPLLESRI